MIHKLQLTLEASGIDWPVLWNHTPCIMQVIQLALSAFMSSLSVQGRTKSWEAHECDQQFGENKTIDIGKSQRLRKEGHARISKVSAMRPGLPKIIEKVHISWYCESSETDLGIAENACGVDYADTWSSKPFHWLSKRNSPHRGTTDDGCEDTLEVDTGVAQARLPITRIHTQVPPKSKIQLILATLHSTW